MKSGSGSSVSGHTILFRRHPSERIRGMQIAWENKELVFPAPVERYDNSGDVVVFWGQDRSQRIQCAISREAIDDYFRSDNRNKLGAIRENDPAVEDIARRKYLTDRVEPDELS